MIKFIYATDLHGDEYKFEALFNFAVDNDLKLIHIGSDLLPKGSDLLGIQKKFVKGYLKRFYQRCKEKGIDVIGFFGNDDIYTRKRYFKEYGTLLDEVSYQKDGFVFTAYPYVLDYPFLLKTACKLDFTGWLPPKTRGVPVDFTDSGRQVIEDLDRYLLEKGTIEEDLKKIHVTDKTIIAIHMPPWGLGLDICHDGRRVGSKSIFDFIKNKQPLIVLSGHIHESFKMSSIWKVNLGKTVIIQPGQADHHTTTLVLIEIDETEIKAQLLTL